MTEQITVDEVKRRIWRGNSYQPVTKPVSPNHVRAIDIRKATAEQIEDHKLDLDRWDVEQGAWQLAIEQANKERHTIVPAALRRDFEAFAEMENHESRDRVWDLSLAEAKRLWECNTEGERWNIGTWTDTDFQEQLLEAYVRNIGYLAAGKLETKHGTASLTLAEIRDVIKDTQGVNGLTYDQLEAIMRSLANHIENKGK